MNRDEADAVFAAVEEALSRGSLELRERSATLGGKSYRGAPLRWVEVAEPPVVYFPDAYRASTMIEGIMTVCFVIAFLAVVGLVVSLTEADWLFAGIFGATSLILGGLGLWLAERSEDFTGTFGLYLTPGALLLRQPKGVVFADRARVLRFGVRRTSGPSAPRVRFGEFVEIEVEGKVVRVELQRGQNNDQRALCEAWVQAAWPIALP